MNRSVVVIGNFDGVHLGHQKVLQSARRHADELAVEFAERPKVVVVTFWPHPMKVFAPELAPKMILRLSDRIKCLKAAGADEVRVVQFNQELSELSPEQFIDQVIEPLNPVFVVVGENFRFGNQAKGDVETLRQTGSFKVDTMELFELDGRRTCSTLIREYISLGDVEKASEHLGRDFFCRGIVVMGDQRGRLLGFPTANLITKPSMVVPSDGVYAGWLSQLGQSQRNWLPSAISVGTNPTFDGVERRVETNVLDTTDLQLYGAEIVVAFAARLRGQIKFESKNDLITQMSKDVAETRRILTRIARPTGLLNIF